MQKQLEQLKKIQCRMAAYRHAVELLCYDAMTTAPSDAGEALSSTLEVLTEEQYRLATCQELKQALTQLIPVKDQLDLISRREVEELSGNLRKTECVPMKEYVDYQVLLNRADRSWHKAKAENRFELFAPDLARIIEYQKKLVKWLDPDRVNAYDVLLNEYEKGLSTAVLDDYFAKVKQTVVPLLQKVRAKPQPDTAFLHQTWPIEKQKQLSDWLMQVLTVDRCHCAIGETEHPFTTNFSKNDVRITTHYHEDDPLSSLYSVVHESGHALYELHTGDELIGTVLAEGTSMGVHESQSRFFENIIGRSEAFCSILYPKMCELFPEQMRNITERQLYRAVNLAQSSLIRTEADELTYSLHILIRYELEKRIFAGTLSVEQLPTAWNRLYKEYLGLDVPDDTHGVLQDSHWSGGAFGYFPSYSVGSAYAAQIYSAMCSQIKVEAIVRSGNLQPIVEWLTERIYRYGKVIDPAEALRNCCGSDFEPRYYLDYLTDKFTTIYRL